MPRISASKKTNVTSLNIPNSGGQSRKTIQPTTEELLMAILEQTSKNNQFNSNTDEQEFDIHDMLGTLPDWVLKQYIQEGLIKVSPLPDDWEDNVDEVTIDFHLGNKLKVFTSDGLNTIDLKHTSRDEMESMMRSVDLKPGQPFILTENDFVIATTKERLTLPDNIIGHLHGKSSLARLGIVVHSTAARFDPGWDGCPVLEFGTFLQGKKIIIYEGSPICAFSFEKMAAPVERSYKQSPNNRYGGYDTPMVSNITGKRKI